MKFENTSSSEICEANLSIEIEDIIQSSLYANRQPRSFYKNFCELILDFDQVYNPDFNWGEFALIRNQAGLNSFKISVKEFVEKKNE